MPDGGAGTVLGAVDDVLEEVEELYLDLHRHPELSMEEERASQPEVPATPSFGS